MSSSVPTLEDLIGPDAPEELTLEELLGPDVAEVDPRVFDEILGPPPLDELEQRVSNLDYTPTDYEVGRLLDLRAQEKAKQPLSDRMGHLGDEAAAGASGLIGLVKDALVRPFQGNLGIRDLGQSMIEGATRSTLRTGEGAYNTFPDSPEDIYAEIPGVKPLMRMAGVPTEKPLTAAQAREKEIEKFRKELEEQKLARDRSKGQRNAVPQVLRRLGIDLPEEAWAEAWTPDPTMAQAAELLDPTIVIGGAEGAIAKGGSVARQVAGRTLARAGREAERVADVGTRISEGIRAVPERVAEGVFGEGTKAAAGLEKAIDRTALIPSIPLAATAAATLPTLEMGGQALQAVGRNLDKPSYSAQLGLLQNISRDPNAPKWVRDTASATRFADPALSAAGRTAEGMLHGGTTSALITAALGGDEDQIARSFGGGSALGGALRATTGRAARLKEAVETDLARWKSGMTPETAATLEQVLPDSAQQARVMNAQRFVSGLGDVDFKYLTDAQWKAEGRTPSRAMEVTEGERPTVLVNVDKIGNGSPVLHEAGHVLRRLLPDEFAGVDRALFSDFTVAEGAGKDFISGRTDTSPGILSPELQQKIYDAYLAKLDPKVRAERESTWSRQEHLNSLREEVTSDFLGSLLQDKRPDYLMRLGGVREKLLGALSASQEGKLLSRIPGLERIRQSTDVAGRATFTIDGERLPVTGKAANELRRVLKVRDRVTKELTADVGENTGVSGIVTPRDIAGDKSGIIAKMYGNSPLFAKDPATGRVIIDPVTKSAKLNDNGAIAKLTNQQHQQLTEALGGVKTTPGDVIRVGGRELAPMTLQPNSKSWEGHYFTDAQLDAVARGVAKNLISPEHYRNILAVNEAIKAGDGAIKSIKYFPATKEKGQTGKRRYAPLGQKQYAVTPYGFLINKEGGLSMRTFDFGSLQNKVNRWMRDENTRSRLSVWQGDREALWKDIYKYLDNHAKGLLNDPNLHPNPIVAVQKRNIISDLLIGKRVNPSDASRKINHFISTDAGKDNPVKTFRIDRLGEIGKESPGKFPVDYFKVKENLLPLEAPDPATGTLPPGVTPGAVIKQAQAQAIHDLRGKLIRAGAPAGLADQIAETGWKKAEKAARRLPAPSERAYTVSAAHRLNQLGPADLQAIRAATIRGGTDGAAEEMGRRLLVGRVR